MMRLTSKGDWESRWSASRSTQGAVSPNQPSFRERHNVFVRFLGNMRGGTCLEVGAHPGNYLRYFYDYFGLEPWGVEYVESCATSTSEYLNAQGVPARILVKDFFDLGAYESPSANGWDLTVSFGFVEHFDDSTDAVAQHINVTKAGGLIIISIPNHAGLNGTLMRLVDKDKWKQHNLMSLRDLEAAVVRAGGADVLYSGYVGRFGLWNAGIYSKLKKRHRRLYPIVRAPLWLMERLGQWLVPNNRFTSPDALVILKKKS